MTDLDTSLRCAGVSFFAFLSLFPAIGTLVLLVGLLGSRFLLEGTVNRLGPILPNPVLDVLSTRLEGLMNQPGEALGLGLLLSIAVATWSGAHGVGAFLYAISCVRSMDVERGFLARLLVSLICMVVGSVFLIAALLMVAGLPLLADLVPVSQPAQRLVLTLRWPVLLTLAVLVITALYRWGPDSHPHKFRFILPGAIVASLLWVLAGMLFSIFVENFGNFEASFGSLTAAVVLLLWLYNSVQVFVLGAALNAQIESNGARVC